MLVHLILIWSKIFYNCLYHGLRQVGARGCSGTPLDFQCHSINAPIVPYIKENVTNQSLHSFKMIYQHNLLEEIIPKMT